MGTVGLFLKDEGQQYGNLGDIAMRYLDCPEGSFPWKIRQLLTANDPAVVQVCLCVCVEEWVGMNDICFPPCQTRVRSPLYISFKKSMDF